VTTISATTSTATTYSLSPYGGVDLQGLINSKIMSDETAEKKQVRRKELTPPAIQIIQIDIPKS